jgi:hypothetical protein
VDTPTYNADGYQTWKPQPGEYYKLGLKQRESYGGVVAAIKDVLAVTSCGVNKAYPHNFAGIIAALEDLADCLDQGNNIDIGEYPPGWEIDIDINNGIIIGGDWTELPKDGNLWFDTRQGRLFVAIDGKYWQTNGGDGLAYVNDGVPEEQPVIGSTWFDTYNKIMYVWTGQGLWEAIRGVDDVAQTTATLPLAFRYRLTAGGGGGARILPEDFPTPEDWPAVLPPLDLVEQNVQADYNEWLLWALFRVGEATEYNTINFGPNPPPEDQLQPGSMWYDTNALELSVWYSDGDSSQWVPTSVSYQYDEQLADITTALETETLAREASAVDLNNKILEESDNLKTDIYTLDNNLRQTIVDKIAEIVIPDPDLTSYSTTVDLTSTRDLLETKISESKDDLEAKLLAVKNELNKVDATVISSLRNKVSKEQLATVTRSIPDISQLTTEATVDSKIAGITNSFLPRTGGVLNGRFELQKDDIDLAALDFSRQASDGRHALMLKAMRSGSKTISFGTTETEGEVAFTFDDDEDFCWIYNDTQKVFSVDRNGPAANNLILGDFYPNDINGRKLRNKIDVRDRLETYQAAFEQMRQGIANASDFDELKSSLLTVLASV